MQKTSPRPPVAFNASLQGENPHVPIPFEPFDEPLGSIECGRIEFDPHVAALWNKSDELGVYQDLDVSSRSLTREIETLGQDPDLLLWFTNESLNEFEPGRLAKCTKYLGDH